jgi:hypothetical protein
MTEQNLNDPDVRSAFQEMRREAMAQRVQRDPFGQTGGIDRRSARSVQHRRINRVLFIPPGKEIGRWPGEPPISAQNAEQLRRQHHVAIFRAFAVTDQDHAARAVATLSPATSEALSPAA